MLAELEYEAGPDKLWLCVSLAGGPQVHVRLKGNSVEIDTRTAKTVSSRGTVDFPDELVPILRVAASDNPDIEDDQLAALRTGLAQIIPGQP